MRLRLQIARRLTSLYAKPKTVYVESRVELYRDLWRSVAQETGASFVELDEDMWQIEIDGTATHLVGHLLEFDNPVTLRLAANKPLIHKLLAAKGLPVPDHLVFRLTELDKAHDFLKKYPNGCVVKPTRGWAGIGVTTHVTNEKELTRSAVLASLYGDQSMIEQQIGGECYRLLVLEGRFIHAVRRSGLRLTGDGRSTVEQLIAKKSRKQGQGPQLPIQIDKNCEFTLEWQGLGARSIPEEGRVFLAKSIHGVADAETEVRTVYNEVVTEQICEPIRASAESAAKIIGSDFLGVDMILTDPAVSLEEGRGVINELNTTPGLHHHFDSKSESYPEIALDILSSLLRPGRTDDEPTRRRLTESADLLAAFAASASGNTPK